MFAPFLYEFEHKLNFSLHFITLETFSKQPFSRDNFPNSASVQTLKLCIQAYLQKQTRADNIIILHIDIAQ